MESAGALGSFTWNTSSGAVHLEERDHGNLTLRELVGEGVFRSLGPRSEAWDAAKTTTAQTKR